VLVLVLQSQSLNMVSLWGSKKTDDENDIDDQLEQEEQQQPRATSSHGPPSRPSEDTNERTRLLPRHDRGVGYLSPDDPAVSYHHSYTDIVSNIARSPLTIYGAYEHCDTSKSSS
jgi:hypothetical protein